MDQCHRCNEFWVSCPCCGESFCPECSLLEGMAEEGIDNDE